MAFIQGEEQPGYSKHARVYSFIDQQLLVSAWDDRDLAMWNKFAHD